MSSSDRSCAREEGISNIIRPKPDIRHRYAPSPHQAVLLLLLLLLLVLLRRRYALHGGDGITPASHANPIHPNPSGGNHVEGSCGGRGLMMGCGRGHHRRMIQVFVLLLLSMLLLILLLLLLL